MKRRDRFRSRFLRYVRMDRIADRPVSGEAGGKDRQQSKAYQRDVHNPILSRAAFGRRILKRFQKSVNANFWLKMPHCELARHENRQQVWGGSLSRIASASGTMAA